MKSNRATIGLGIGGIARVAIVALLSLMGSGALPLRSTAAEGLPAGQVVVDVDGVRVLIPCPRGMVSILGLDTEVDALAALAAPNVHTLHAAFADSTNWLAFRARPSPPDFSLISASVQSVQHMPRDPAKGRALFDGHRAQLRPMLASGGATYDSLVKAVGQEMSATRRDQLGLDAIELGQQVPLGLLRDEPEALTWMVLMRARTQDSGEGATEALGISGTSLMWINDRMIYLNATMPIGSRMEEVGEMRELISGWTDAVQRANSASVGAGKRPAVAAKAVGGTRVLWMVLGASLLAVAVAIGLAVSRRRSVEDVSRT